MEQPQNKCCIKCGTPLTVENTTPSYLKHRQYTCKSCTAKYSKEWKHRQLQNPERQTKYRVTVRKLWRKKGIARANGNIICPICHEELPKFKRSLNSHCSHMHPGINFCQRCHQRLTSENWGYKKRKICRACKNALNRLAYRKYPSIRLKELQRSRNRRQFRVQIIQLLGGRCQECGFSDVRALQIDHVNGGGRQERLKHNGCSPQYYKMIYQKIQEGSLDYQVLCANCNTIKEFEKLEKTYRQQNNGVVSVGNP